MGRPEPDPTDLISQIAELRCRIERLEGRTGLRQYAAADRPPAVNNPYMLIANTTTGKVEWSDGAVWTPLY